MPFVWFKEIWNHLEAIPTNTFRKEDLLTDTKDMMKRIDDLLYIQKTNFLSIIAMCYPN